ncbi:hypothetical protein JN531_016845 (plasmid) [Flagellatimonas centrodinii]|uniref:hypothetical protein n=1 Tax=Flagellatimonas centrodinii TaxID=2806210 RepID=UPI001FEFE989|nr:hypothetical protein [Flagellatimonas centrodinii]ULQ48446.1 hypothetical protein JN531_016845 [Flagellatimonas centrodinii]
MSVVSPYKIRFIDSAGELHSRTVEGRSEQEALTVSGIPKGRVRSIGLDRTRELIGRFSSRAPSLEVQENVIMLFAPAVKAGRPVSSTFDKIVSGYAKFRSKMPQVRRADRISDKLRILNFDSQVVLIAEIGERTNMLGEVLGDLVNDLRQRSEIMGAMYRGMIPAVLTLLFGMLGLIGLPLYMGDELATYVDTPGMKFENNAATDALILVGNALPLIWPILIGIAVAIYVFRGPIWTVARHLPLLSSIEHYLSILRAYGFVSAFLPLYSRNVSVNESIALLRQRAVGRTKRLYAAIEDGLSRGGSIASAFGDDSGWYEGLRFSMQGFSEVRDEDRPKILEHLRPSLIESLRRSSAKVNTSIMLIGLLFGVISITTLAFGMFFPIAGMSPDTVYG